MSWRDKYLIWYDLIKDKLGDLIPALEEREVLESVSNDDLLSIPTIFDNLEPKKRKYVPNIFMALTEEAITLGILYNSKERLDHFQNIFHDSQIDKQEKLFKILSELPLTYETKLYKQNRRTGKDELLRKYITQKLDINLLKKLIEEAEIYRRGGRITLDTQSIYIPPQKTKLSFTEQKISIDIQSFNKILEDLNPIYTLLINIKNPKDLIKERLERPKRKKNEYRKFVEIINEVRRKELISAQERREYDRRWRNYEDERDYILSELKEKLN
jgi:hypothetical protein